MAEINELNIPAFQRKRSLAAKARRRPNSFTSHVPTKPSKSRTLLKSRKALKERFDPPIIEIPLDIRHENDFPNPLDIFKPQSKKSSNFREMKLCGRCDGYFDKIEVAIVKVTSPIRKGDTIIFEKDEGLFEQEITSMQINRKDVSLARSGDDIGLKVFLKPKVGTSVYKVI